MTGSQEPKLVVIDVEEARRRDEFVSTIYADLETAWRHRGIELPALNEHWQQWLRSAIDAANKIEDEESRTRMGVLAVPPPLWLWSSVGARRATQARALMTSARIDIWRLLAVDMNPDSGIYFGTVNRFLREHASVGGWDVTQLGIPEYEALVAQTDGSVDCATFTSTYLPGDRGEQTTPYATTDLINGVHYGRTFSDVHYEQIGFRLAAEIPQPSPQI